LLFQLTYPTPAKPELANASAAATSSKGIHLVSTSPTIGTPVQQVKPGVPFLVNGSNFPRPFANAMDLSWTYTLPSPGQAELQWGPKGGEMKSATIPGGGGYNPAANTYHVTDLQPSTPYQFRVHECDTITCTPWSDWLEVSTEATGSNDVKVWLDNDTANPIGTGAVGPNGALVVKATMPADTSSGSHTINAGTEVGKSQASASIAVCAAGGCGPSISVMNTQSNTTVTPPAMLIYPATFTLRGNDFTAGTPVTVYLDTASGAELGSSTPNNLGIFEGKFTLPMVQSGTHTLVAVQVVQGKTVQATVSVDLEPQPK
jgi:hypothetical protein